MEIGALEEGYRLSLVVAVAHHHTQSFSFDGPQAVSARLGIVEEMNQLFSNLQNA